MRHRIPVRRVGWLLAPVLLWSASCSRAPRIQAKLVSSYHVKVRMISGARHLVQGTTEELGILFTIEPGWHLYSRSRSDAGLPLLLAPSAPEGYRFGPMRWPAPQRLVSEGGILDHVYEGEVTVLLPVDIPADARPGDTATFRCHADWLVCKTECIPGQGDPEISLPIGRPGDSVGKSGEENHLRAARLRIPSRQESMAGLDAGAWELDRWSLRVPGATALEFYPDSACAPLQDPIRDAAVSGDRLLLRLASEATDESPTTRQETIAGILSVTTAHGDRFVHIESVRPPVREVRDDTKAAR
jgi:DsbC/DsbD-like thiol-disulfide interchange protein